MSKITIIDYDETYITREADPNDEWDKDDTSTSHSIQGIKIDEKDWYNLDTIFDVEPNTPYYLVYAIYSTGDSFHHENGRIIWVALYKTKEKAEYAIQKLGTFSSSECMRFPYSYSCIIALENGQLLNFDCPWIGYFEDLEDLDYIEVKICDE